jgi:hypothetical protein
MMKLVLTSKRLAKYIEIDIHALIDEKIKELGG